VQDKVEYLNANNKP